MKKSELIELYDFIDKRDFTNEINKVIKETLGAIISEGNNDIQLSFDDIKTVMNNKKIFYYSIGDYDGECSTEKALKIAMERSSLDTKQMSKVTGILIHFLIHPSLCIQDIADAMKIVYENINENSNVFFGTTNDESLNQNYVKVTLLFTR